MENIILQNIYDFYGAIGKEMSTSFYQSESISWLNSGNGNWPNMIYNVDVDESEIDPFIKQQISAIKAKKAPPFWLVNHCDKNKILQEKLKLNGFREIFRWTGMGLNTDKIQKLTLPKNYQLKIINQEDELKYWLQVVNIALMTGNQIGKSVFEKLYLQPNFKLYLVTNNEQPVATGLAFFNKNYCGIYMIATLEENRKKGIGTAITQQCINDAIKKGIKNIVLQASPKGESIYQKMGFKNYSEFSIYWLLGKEFK